MPAGITVRQDGFAEAAFSLKPAWHGLGQVLDRPMTSAEAMAASGLDWRVEQTGLYRRLDQQYVPVQGYRLNVRSDNGFVLGLVSKDYQVVQNADAFGFLDELVEGHEMLYESAFSLHGGKRVVLLARMPGYSEVAKNDTLLPYILMSLGHDGSNAIQFGPCATRVVCANTHAIAVTETDKHTGQRRVRELSIRHMGDVKTKLAEARNIIAAASREFSLYTEIGQQLARKRLTVDEWREFLDIMCPIPSVNDPDWTPRRADALRETRMAIWRAYRGPRNQTAPETAWAAYCAVVEHIDHLPRRGATPRAKAEARFNVALYGPGRVQKERAWRTACKIAGIALSG